MESELVINEYSKFPEDPERYTSLYNMNCSDIDFVVNLVKHMPKLEHIDICGVYVGEFLHALKTADVKTRVKSISINDDWDDFGMLEHLPKYITSVAITCSEGRMKLSGIPKHVTDLTVRTSGSETVDLSGLPKTIRNLSLTPEDDKDTCATWLGEVFLDRLTVGKLPVYAFGKIRELSVLESAAEKWTRILKLYETPAQTGKQRRKSI